jgi:uncharacterized protein YdeI (BOF family)
MVDTATARNAKALAAALKVGVEGEILATKGHEVLVFYDSIKGTFPAGAKLW